ncbi:MAG TPA: diadenylate cyclase [Bryobacteraceae bacterium]|nr:diadenylate cyclase [Bryobacteraceae bacterium]
MLPLRWQTFVDFLALAAALYILLRWSQRARALRIALTIVGLHVLALLARHFELMITGWLLDGAAALAAIYLLLAFRAELRHAFLGLDSLLAQRPSGLLTPTYRAIGKTAFNLAAERLGGLMVLVRRDAIEELLDGGVALRAEVSAELLDAIFQKTSPLHDGAVILENDRVAMANAVLPLTERKEVPPHYGTRHRAGMGLAERCDALVVVVSEERGEVTLMDGRVMRRMDHVEELVQLLQRLESRAQLHLKQRLWRVFAANLKFKFAALGLAGLLWGMTFLVTGTTVRTVSVPVEFINVPAGMEITRQSFDHLQVQVSGSSWIMDSVSLSRLVARFDLRSASAGLVTLRITPGVLNLPPGLVMERVSPEGLEVRLVPRRPPKL